MSKSILAVAALSFLPAWAGAAEMNLLANGGFESCGRLGARRVEMQKKRGLTFDSPDPLLPLRWMWMPHGSADMRMSSDAHRGKRALRVACPKGGFEMEMQIIEVVPGATYSFGGWAKGKGAGRIVVYGNAYEGRRELAAAKLAFQPKWAEARQKVTIPGNMRTVCVGLAVSRCAEALVDDVFFSADVAQPFDVNAVMTTKFEKDARTLLLVDFDGQGKYRLESKAALTDEKGGRFGRGVRIGEKDASTAIIPLALKAMPPEGTLEFWLSPDDEMRHRTKYMGILSGSLEVMCFDDHNMLRFRGRAAERGDKWNDISWRYVLAAQVWVHKGLWHHVAFTWDAEALRLYVDGALAGYSTKRPLPFLKKLPSAIRMGGDHILNAWSGVVDEVRLSDVRRYGPVIPRGARWRPLPAAGPTVAKTPPAKPPSAGRAPDFAKERKALIGTIPAPPAGAIAFDAAQVKPLVADDPDFRILADTPVAGMKVAKVGTPQGELIRLPDNDGGYWKLTGVPVGRYYVGIWYESSIRGIEARQQIRGRLDAYLNGRALQLSTHSDPVQVAPGVHYAEAQSKSAEVLRDGDEIAVLGSINQPVRLARLVLHRREPRRGRGWMFENYGADMFTRDSALRMNVFCGFQVERGKALRKIRHGMDTETDSPDCLKKDASGKALAYYRLANPLPVPLTVTCRTEIRAYFRELVGREETTIRLKPHERVTREVAFTILPDSRRYSMQVNAEAVKPPGLSASGSGRQDGRPSLGWPATDTIDFFPGVRQSVPWPDPFRNEFRRSIGFGQPMPGTRQEISLNGDWKSAFTPLPTKLPVPPPADLKWQPRRVPFRIGGHNEKPPAHGLYVRRKVVLPEGGGRRTWRLLITAVLDEATAYVNGTKVGNVRGCRTPLLCDITQALRPGENEILIAVRDALANMNPAYVNPSNPVVSYQYLEAPGQGYAHAFAVDGVKLLASPLVSAEDLQVIASVRKKKISARFKVANRQAAARKLRVKVSVQDAGKQVLAVGEAAVALAAGQSKPLDLSAAWANPVFWGPGSPKLYTLSVEVTDAATGERLDLLRERFGFRESWIDNGRIMLNGSPVRLKGSNCGGGGGLVGGDDVQWTRGSDGVEDFLDEFGLLAGYYTLGGLGNTPSRHNVENDSFWRIETKNVLAGAAVYVNHPCLIAWDLSNEWLSFLGYGGGDPLAGAKRFKAVGDALAAYDPSRWIIFDGDGDLHGLWDTQSEHYMVPYPVEFSMRGHSGYLPDSRFWRELDKDFKPGEGVVASTYRSKERYHPDKKAIMNTENAWKVDGLQPPGLSMVVGEDDVLSPAIDSGRGQIVWYWKQNVDGHRDLGVSIVCNYTPVTGLAHRGHMLQCFIMPEHSHHYFAGRKVQRRYSLHNDLLVGSQFEFRWSLVDAKGKAVAQGRDRRRMDSGDMQRGRFSFDLPKVDKRTHYTLRLDLLANGKFAYGEQRDIEVWPDAAPAFAAPARKIALFDPAGRTAAVFGKAGIPFVAMDSLAAPEGRPPETVLVLGEGAVRGKVEAAAGPLSKFVSAGGRIVALMQDNPPPGLPVRTTLEKREWCSIAFPRTPQHPVLKGLDAWDLHFWAPDHVVAKGAYSKPDSGSFVSLIDGAGDHDRGGRSAMDWIELMECYRGEGSYLLCQLPLAEKYDAEPMAREMLARVMSYAAGAAAFRVPTKRLCFVGAPAAATATKLRDMGVAFQLVEAGAKLDRKSVVMVDAATAAAGPKAAAAWKTALERGATILVHGATAKHKPLLAALAGKPVEMTVQPYAMWEGRGYRNGFTWLTPGLSHIDLYWKGYAGNEGAVAQAEEPKHKIEDLSWWSVKAEGAVEHVFPGVLVEIAVGRGRLIVDGIRWETANKKLARHSLRVLSSLMVALDVAVAPYVPQRPLAADVIYRPIDLSAFCNRAFKDEIGDDGKGGWADQGPKADLREFPTGKRNFGGVPFAVGKDPRCCIVLKSNRRPASKLAPDEVTIPIGFPVEGLCFLHTLTWLGGNEPAGTYQVQYADGTTREIALVGQENIRDWTAAPAQFPRERGTRSRVAWTGTTEMFPLVCVFQMQWVNPRPLAAVRAVRFSNPAKTGCPILIAVTAAVKPGKADLEAIAAAQAKARQWLQKGIAAADAGKHTEAREALRQAVREDPKLDAAHQRLCELAERGKDDSATLAAYKAWAAASARTPLPYNKIGVILERRGDDRGALDAYTKSLEIEWNQPPIIEAKAAADAEEVSPLPERDYDCMIAIGRDVDHGDVRFGPDEEPITLPEA